MKVFVRLYNFVFFPFSLLWNFVYKLRRFFYQYGIFKQVSFDCPIISIGNLTFGGSGKTPTTLWIAELLESLNLAPLILMRGYKGEFEKGYGLIESSKSIGFSPSEFGDEAIIYANRLQKSSIVVGARRADNLKYFLRKKVPDAVILDDGHQHLSIQRDLNIVLFDASLPLERLKVAPLGYLREGFSALNDTDMIILGKSRNLSEQKRKEIYSFLKEKLIHNIPIIETDYKVTGVYTGNHEKSLDVHELKGRRVVCAAAIASPESFYRTVEDLGAQLIKSYSYADHYYYTHEDIEEICRYAKEHEAIVLVTQKDIVKMRRMLDNQPIYYLEISLEFLKGEVEFKDLILGTINK